MKKTATAGLQIIKKHEGFRARPYLCPAGIPTIGYGNTYYPNGQKVQLSDPPITHEQATAMLQAVLEKYEGAVSRYVQTAITQAQFDALVSFAYNVGMENLRQSTLLKKVNRNPADPTIRAEFAKWTRANGRILEGLKKRRAEEAELYFSNQS